MSSIQQILKDARARDGQGHRPREARVLLGPLRQGVAEHARLGARSRCTASRWQLNQVATRQRAGAARRSSSRRSTRARSRSSRRRSASPDLGLEPSAQGAIIRVPLPQMNEQRRKELVKIVHKYAEEGKVAVRHARTHGARGAQEAHRRVRGRREARREGPAESCTTTTSTRSTS